MGNKDQKDKFSDQPPAKSRQPKKGKVVSERQPERLVSSPGKKKARKRHRSYFVNEPC